MKKFLFMAVAAIAALSSCSNNDEFEQTQIGNQGLVFTATMEGAPETRATYDGTNKCASWVIGDKISINGVSYSAQTAGTTTTFKADGEDTKDTPYNAYFPADLYNGTTATLPAIKTYTAGKFNMPMYASSTTTELAFKNLCAVLAIKVTDADIATLKSIKVASDQKMNGSFTVTSTTDGGYKAEIGSDGSNEVVLSMGETPIDPTTEGTTFYIAIPAQTYKSLSIAVSDGTTTKLMKTKQDQEIKVARNTVYHIAFNGQPITGIAKATIGDSEVDVKWVQLWEGGPKFAEYNVGASSATELGSPKTYTDATAENFIWGPNWQTPIKDDLKHLLNAASGNTDEMVTCEFCEYITEDGISGFKFTGKETGYTSNSVFFSAGEGDGSFCEAYYWSATADGESRAWYMKLGCEDWNCNSSWGSYMRGAQNYVRPVLKN